MPRKVKASSDASKKKIDIAYSKAFEGIMKSLDAIILKLDNKEALSDEEIRFLKKSNSIINELQLREKEREEGPCILPDNLKRFVSMLEKEIELIGKDADREQIFNEMGFYRCTEICGELHPEGARCPLVEYSEMLKSTRSTEELEDE